MKKSAKDWSRVASGFSEFTLTSKSGGSELQDPKAQEILFNLITTTEPSMNLLLQLRKLRESIIASRRVDKFGLDSFIYSVDMAFKVHFDSVRPCLLSLFEYKNMILRESENLELLDDHRWIKYNKYHFLMHLNEYIRGTTNFSVLFNYEYIDIIKLINSLNYLSILNGLKKFAKDSQEFEIIKEGYEILLNRFCKVIEKSYLSMDGQDYEKLTGIPVAEKTLNFKKKPQNKV